MSDTGTKNNSCNLVLWQYQEEYRDVVTKALEERFGIPCDNGFPDQLEDIAAKLAKDYWDDYHSQIMYELSGSTLEGMDEYNVGVEFRDVASVSTAYVLLSRCGLHVEKHFRLEDFRNLNDFNTPKLIQILGVAVNQAGSQVLHQIGMSILSYERQKQTAQQHSNASEAEGDGKPSASGNSTAKASKPTVQEIYSQYKPVIKDFLLSDTAYQNACKNSDRENAELEGEAAVKRAALSLADLRFLKVYYDVSEFHNSILREIFAETYTVLAETQEQKPELSASEAKQDGNNALADAQQPAVDESDPEDDMSPDDTTEAKSAQDNTNPDATESEPAEGNTDPDATEAAPTEIILEPSEVRELPAAENFTITDDQLGTGGPKAKFAMNMAAITVLKQIEAEKRTATPEEQQTLSRYVGWGGIPDAFDENKADWEREYTELKTALTPKEYVSARASTLNAH